VVTVGGFIFCATEVVVTVGSFISICMWVNALQWCEDE
jgi:hypothetical protein